MVSASISDLCRTIGELAAVKAATCSAAPARPAATVSARAFAVQLASVVRPNLSIVRFTSRSPPFRSRNSTTPHCGIGRVLEAVARASPPPEADLGNDTAASTATFIGRGRQTPSAPFLSLPVGASFCLQTSTGLCPAAGADMPLGGVTVQAMSKTQGALSLFSHGRSCLSASRVEVVT